MCSQLAWSGNTHHACMHATITHNTCHMHALTHTTYTTQMYGKTHALTHAHVHSTHLLCLMWLLTRWPAAKADMRDSSPASTAPHTIRARLVAFVPGSSWWAPCTRSSWWEGEERVSPVTNPLPTSEPTADQHCFSRGSLVRGGIACVNGPRGVSPASKLTGQGGRCLRPQCPPQWRAWCTRPGGLPPPGHTAPSE